MTWHRVIALLALSLLLLAAAPPTPPLISGRPLEAWLADLDDNDQLIREEAIEVLAQLGPKAKAALPKIRPLLKHPYRPMRTRAAIAVWRIGGDAQLALEALTENLRGNKPELRLETLELLSEMHTQALPALPLVLPYLSENDYYLRTAAIRLFQRIGPEIVPALLREAEKGSRTNRRNALSQLGAFHLLLGDEAVSVLRRCLNDEDRRVRVDAAKLLWLLRGPERRVLDTLLEGVKSVDTVLRSEIISTVSGSHSQSPELLPLLNIAVAAPHPYTQVRAARLLYRIEKNVARVMPIYQQVLNDASLSHWDEAFSGLTELGEEAQTTLPRLVEILRMENIYVPYEIRETLLAIGPVCIPELIHLLNSVFPQHRNDPTEVALYVLGALGKPAVNPLWSLLQSPNETVRQRALRCLASIGPPARETAPTVLKLISSEKNTHTLQLCVNLLSVLGELEDATKAELLKLARGKEQLAAATAMQVLTRIGVDNKVGLELALNALKSANSAEKKLVGLTLLIAVAPRHERVQPELLALLKNAPTRDKALELVGQLGEDAKKFIPDLITLLKTGDQAVRLAVLRTLQQLGPAGRASAPAVIETLVRTPNEHFSQQAISVLAAIGAEASVCVEPLAELVRSRRGLISHLAVQQLARFGGEAKVAFPAVLQVMRDPGQPTFTRTHAALALTQIDANRARTEAMVDLHRLLTLEIDTFTVARALLTVDPNHAPARVFADNCLRIGNSYTRGFACFQLGRLGKQAERYLPRFRELLRDEFGYTRLAAATAVCRVTGKTDEAGPVIIGLLKDPKTRNLRSQTLDELGELGSLAAPLVPQLRGLLKTAEPDFRQQLKQAIRKIETDRTTARPTTP